MENKSKFIILGLVGVSAIFVFLYIQTLNSKQLALRERDDFKKENTALSSKLDMIENSIRDYENKIALLNKELDRVSQEKQEIGKKFELVNKEKQQLIDRLKAQQAQLGQAAPQAMSTTPTPVTTDAYWAGILKAKTDLELQLGNLRNELKSTQTANEQLQREKSTFDLDINNFRRENTDLKRQLEYNQKLIDTVTQELVREKNDKIKIQDTFKSIRNENAMLMRQLKSLSGRKVDLEKKLEELQEKNAAIEQKFTEMQTMLTDRISQINDLKEKLDAIRSSSVKKEEEAALEKKDSVELPPIVVRPQSETHSKEAAVATLTGKILAINKDTNFVIIDLGEEAGINIGNSFQVYRDGNSIATIEVIQTRKNIAACDIKKETTPIKVGDIVK